MAEPVNLGTWDVRRGDGTEPYTIEDFGSDGVTASDLTTFGSSWAAQARTSPDTEPAVTISIDHTNAATGVLVLSLAAVDTAAMTEALYVFDVQATGGTIDPVTVYHGTIRVTKDVTHA